MQQLQRKLRGLKTMDNRKFLLLITVLVTVLAAILFTFFTETRPPLEPFPMDWGWIGFVFIFGNGFFLSYCLLNKKIDALDRLLLTVGLGFGVTFVVMILLGVLWQITLTTILLTHTFLLMAFAANALRRGLKLTHFALEPKNIQLTKQNLLQVIPLAIIGVLTCTAIYNALSLPPTEWDSLAYGVNYAKIIFQNSHIPLIAGPSIGLEMSAAYPPGFQLTAVTLYTFAGEANDFYYRILSPIFSLATMIVTYKFAMLLNRNRTFSIYAVSALVMIPFFWELFIQETYIMALTLLLTSAAYFFYKAHVSDATQTRTLEVIGILFCAFAALTSYMGLIAFGILLIYALQKRIPTKRIVVLFALGLAIILPWYVRNLVLLGNPVYPFFGLGYYLDPLLKNSTPQHFQEYTTLPIYAWSTLVAKISVVLVAVGILFFTFSKRREFRWALPLYLLLASLGVMAFHVAFPRYLILAIPILSVIFSTLFLLVPKKYKLQQLAAVAFIALMVLTSAVMLPYINTIKPHPESSESQAEYLSTIFEEGDAWQWINQNTPTNTRIATFDIKEYYINRDIFYLDGNESTPLYKMNTIQECVSFLQERGVEYILSVPWASSMAVTIPPAYNWTLLTRYLCDYDYLPLVFVGANGTAVYHVGPLSMQELNEALADDLVYPLKQFPINLTITNSFYPYRGLGQFYLPIPVDYRGLNITASVYSSHALEVHLLNGKTPTDVAGSSEYFMIANSPYGLLGDETAALSWTINKGGYFTVRVVDVDENFEDPLNVTVNIAFVNNT
jgi:hypothetical protein